MRVGKGKAGVIFFSRKSEPSSGVADGGETERKSRNETKKRRHFSVRLLRMLTCSPSCCFSSHRRLSFLTLFLRLLKWEHEKWTSLCSRYQQAADDGKSSQERKSLCPSHHWQSQPVIPPLMMMVAWKSHFPVSCPIAIYRQMLENSSRTHTLTERW